MVNESEQFFLITIITPGNRMKIHPAKAAGAPIRGSTVPPSTAQLPRYTFDTL